MAQEMSIEAILSAVDQNFTKTMEQAVDSLSKVVGQSNKTASTTTSATGSVKNLATSLGLVAKRLALSKIRLAGLLIVSTRLTNTQLSWTRWGIRHEMLQNLVS